MIHASSLRSLAAALLTTAAWVGAAAWADAIRVGVGAVPSVPWAETAWMAARGGTLLAAPILGSVLLVWAVSALGGVRRARRAAPGAVERAPRGGAGAAAGVPGALAAGVLFGWAAALAVLAASGFSVKIGWFAGAPIAGAASGWFVARRIVRRAGGRPSAARWPGAAGAVSAIFLWGSMFVLPVAARAGGGGGVLAAAPEDGPPGIVLIIVDALRADRLGAYGYTRRPTSPNIDRFAAAAVRFEDAVAPSSWTLPAVASILTSSMPGRSGVADKGDLLAREADDLASRLAAAGYATAALSTNPWLKRHFGFDDGFEAYYDLDRLGLVRLLTGVRLKNLALRRIAKVRIEPELVPEAHEVTERALRWLRRHGGRPFFLYLHYMDVHAPYDPIEPYHGIFCSGHRFDLPDHLLESKFRNGKYEGNAAVLEHIQELYDEDIVAADEAIGRLLSGVEAMGLASRTGVFLLADHGEEFYEHGGTTHGRTLYQEVVHVPLIAAAPGWSLGGPADAEGGARGRVVRARVSALDVYPTILEWAGAVLPEGIGGVSLEPHLRRRGVEGPAGLPEPRVLGAQLFLDGRSTTALYAGADKLIRSRPAATDPAAASTIELYHLDRDPAERSNAAPGEPQRAAGLASVMDGLEKVWGVPGIGGKPPSQEVDAETLRQLKALGYIN